MAMHQLLCLTLTLIASVQSAAEPAEQEPLPDSPAFREPHTKILPAGVVFQNASKGLNLWVAVSPKGRSVILRAHVCLQKGPLEEFLCLTRTKEHESVLAAEVDPRTFHAALMFAGAKPGSVAKFQPNFQPPTGDPIEIRVEFKESF